VSSFVAAIRSLATYVAISLYVLLIGTPFVLLAIVIRNPSMLYRVGEWGVRLGLFLSGITVRIEGGDHIQRERAAVYAVNHASNVEPPILFVALRDLFPRLRILYKAELRSLPILTQAFDLGGFVPLERGNPEQSLPAIDRAAQALREGSSFLIFPEGTRSRTGALLPFKKGGFIMALKAQAPVVPVAISGARNAMRKGSYVIRPVEVRVRFGRPVETAGLEHDQRDALVAEVRAKVEEMLKEADPAPIAPPSRIP
jgi:1-acyl-sn-glycerol-3-phosphate acyltransferase